MAPLICRIKEFLTMPTSSGIFRSRVISGAWDRRRTSQLCFYLGSRSSNEIFLLLLLREGERERERERERKLKLEAGAFRAQLPRRPQFESHQKVLAVMNQFLYLSKSVIVTVRHHIIFLLTSLACVEAFALILQTIYQRVVANAAFATGIEFGPKTCCHFVLPYRLNHV